MTADELAQVIRAGVAEALAVNDSVVRSELLREVVASAFSLAYEEQVGHPGAEPTLHFVASLGDTIHRTVPDGSDTQVDRVTAWLAVAALNAATEAAAPPDATLTWRTMRDDAVRELHRGMDGVTVAAGEPFDVGGHPLLYPGQPVGPPEIWANCRCVLDTNISTSVIAAVSEEPWSNWSSSDYTIEQWRRACLITMPDGDPDSKSTYKLPVRTPSGAVNRNGVHAAAAALAGARGGVDAPPAQKAKAKAALRSLYRMLKEDPPSSIAAAATDEADALLGWPKSTSPPGTHDAPGWITNPRDTQRLRDYWTKGAGAAKIRWGAPNDFYRCRRQLAKYVRPPYLDGTCANLHFVALGYWPHHGPHASGEPAAPPDTEGIAVTDAFTAAATQTGSLPSGAWFTDPGLTGPTPLTVTADGRVFGHLATWETCHVGIEGRCTTAPHSAQNYAHFRTGEIDTTDGPVAVGQITMDTRHASPEASPADTARHYDHTGTAVADVAAGEDAYGIWVAGALRPGISNDQRHALRAGALSGDWRRVGGNLELVAALVVNVPGFPIPREELAASAGRSLSLVAAGMVIPDPNAVSAERVAELVVAAMDNRTTRRARVAALTGPMAQLRVERMKALVAAATE